MFFTFLHKDDVHYMDLSLIIQYPPQDVLFYYYDSFIKIPLDIYQQTSDLAKNGPRGRTPCKLWLDLWDSYLDAAEGVEALASNEYIHTIGPYYFLATNTRFYFTKDKPDSSQTLTEQDFATICSLRETPVMLDEVSLYLKAKKNSKKSNRNREDLLREIDICLLSLQEIEKLNRHHHYLQKLIEQRQAILSREDVLPAEPDNIPEKPSKPEIISREGLIALHSLLKRSRKKYQEECSRYNHEMKVYLLRYREYEKACERYKDTLEKWQQCGDDFRETCLQDINQAEAQLANTRQMLNIYNSAISRSPVHQSYQDIKTLNTFKQYLETGRANDLQDCMNLFEEERHWHEIKASQERIENTIYFLHNSDDGLRFANEHIDRLLGRKQESLEQHA
ncbi:MAG: hypothetical protein GXZ09_06590 [Syntrophomonadaceae bacterium]|jgi:hypothetical protein|nr:hypothetical protein [Syntrophomonadaceae bacterium]